MGGERALLDSRPRSLYSHVEQLLVCLLSGSGTGGGGSSVTDGGQDDARVESQAIKGDIEGEPGPGATKEDLAVLPLGVIVNEILKAGLRSLGLLVRGLGVDDEATGGDESVDVLRGLLDISLDVHLPGSGELSVSRS